MVVQIRSVISYVETARRRFFGQRVRQTQIAEFEMMTVGFPVRGDIDHWFAVGSLGKGIDEVAT